MLTIHYDPIDVIVKICDPGEITINRKIAGFKNGSDFADACNVGRTRMHYIEKGKIKRIPLSEVEKMIRVINGSS